MSMRLEDIEDRLDILEIMYSCTCEFEHGVSEAFTTKVLDE